MEGDLSKKEIKAEQKQDAQMEKEIKAVFASLWQEEQTAGLLAVFLPYVNIVLLAIILILLILKK